MYFDDDMKEVRLPFLILSMKHDIVVQSLSGVKLTMFTTRRPG